MLQAFRFETTEEDICQPRGKKDPFPQVTINPTCMAEIKINIELNEVLRHAEAFRLLEILFP